MQKLASIHSKILLAVKVRLSAHQNRCKEHRQGYNQFEMLRYHDFEHFGDTSLVNLARGKFLSHSDLLSSPTALVILYNLSLLAQTTVQALLQAFRQRSLQAICLAVNHRTISYRRYV